MTFSFLKSSKEKVSGSDLVPKVCELAHQWGFRLFFLGGRPGAAEAAKAKLRLCCIRPEIYEVFEITRLNKIFDIKSTQEEALEGLGFEKDQAELDKIAQMIKLAKPDILFVGLGAPKQERWIKRYHKELGVPVSMGVGVTFEFIAGIVKRAPKWMQHVGLEWFWRLCMEPRRLWKRYLIHDMHFFGIILKQKFRRPT